MDLEEKLEKLEKNVNNKILAQYLKKEYKKWEREGNTNHQEWLNKLADLKEEWGKGEREKWMKKKEKTIETMRNKERQRLGIKNVIPETSNLTEVNNEENNSEIIYSSLEKESLEEQKEKINNILPQLEEENDVLGKPAVKQINSQPDLPEKDEPEEYFERMGEYFYYNQEKEEEKITFHRQFRKWLFNLEKKYQKRGKELFEFIEKGKTWNYQYLNIALRKENYIDVILLKLI